MAARRAVRLATAGATAVSLLLSACAYYNTLYNAKEKYREAERASQRSAEVAATSRRGAPQDYVDPNAPLYEDVVAKCKKMIANYPDSRHVDDAVVLSARALYALGRYDEAVAAIDTLEMTQPKSNLLDDARFLKGKSFVAAEKYDLAVPALRDYADRYKGHDDHAEGLYLLCASLMEQGMDDDAVATLHRLEKEHGRSKYRFTAQVEMARILSDKERYDQSLAVYQRLSNSRIPESFRYEVWLGMAIVQEKVGDFAGALATANLTRTLPRSVENEPKVLLVRARAHAALDSTREAIDEYRDVAKRFSRGIYAAEAYFRLGEIYEGMDSLQTAQQNYTEVARAYASSEFAEEAIKRSSNIGRMLKLEQMAGDDSPEAVAMRTFSMAEIQFFQFSNTEKAIESYEKVATDFPDSEYAPRAVYALGYINGVVLGDTLKAREWYELLRTRYSESAQAQLAYGFYHGAGPPPSPEEMMRASAAALPDSLREPAPHDTTRVPPPAPADTTRSPAPADTTTAPADSSGGSG